MAERVVDGLEVVEVDEEECGRRLPAPPPGQAVVDPVGEQQSVGEAGERVVERLVARLGLEVLALGHVVEHEEDLAAAGRGQWREHRLEPAAPIAGGGRPQLAAGGPPVGGVGGGRPGRGPVVVVQVVEQGADGPVSGAEGPGEGGVGIAHRGVGLEDGDAVVGVAEDRPVVPLPVGDETPQPDDGDDPAHQPAVAGDEEQRAGREGSGPVAGDDRLGAGQYRRSGKERAGEE